MYICSALLFNLEPNMLPFTQFVIPSISKVSKLNVIISTAYSWLFDKKHFPLIYYSCHQHSEKHDHTICH